MRLKKFLLRYYPPGIFELKLNITASLHGRSKSEHSSAIGELNA